MDVAGQKRPYSPAASELPERPPLESMPQLSLKRKLTGRTFYESLGSPRKVLAPMVDRSEFAWRMLTRSFVNPLSDPIITYSPMFHARLFTETSKYRDEHFQPTREGLDKPAPPIDALPYLDGNPAIDRPLFVQFCANDPQQLLQAAKYVEPYCDAVDLNLGCPQGIARKGHYGAFLQEDWKLIHNLINILHRELSVPVTAKMRILETKEKSLEYAKMILDAGASIITVHGRRREQKGHNTGLADWSVLRYLRENLPPETVIFANGNVLNDQDLEKCLQATGADAVMSAEGNLSDPAIFADPPSTEEVSRDYWRGKDGKGGWRVDAVLRRYLDIIHRYVLEIEPPIRNPLSLSSEPPSTTPLECPSLPQISSSGHEEPSRKRRRKAKGSLFSSPNIVSIQGHLFGLLRPLVSKHTNIRDQLARTRAGDLQGFENVLLMVEDAVKEAIMDYETNPQKYDEPGPLQPISNDAQPDIDDFAATITKYRRPWWVCQPCIRPSPQEALEKKSMTLSKQEKKRVEKEGSENDVLPVS